jgi:hypothetical protein
VIAFKAVVAKTGETAKSVIGLLLVKAAKKVGTDLTQLSRVFFMVMPDCIVTHQPQTRLKKDKATSIHS